MEFLQTLFIGELMNPSSAIWISSPWINDVDLVDNSARQFGTLIPNWPPAMIRLSTILATFLDRGVRLTLILNFDPQNDEFFARMSRMSDSYPDTLRIIRTDEVHEKGIVTDRFTLDGSMNITFRGVHINQEYLGYRCDPELVYQRQLVLEQRWGK